MKNRFLQKGITIIELILYMSILSVLITILTSIFISALDVQSESSAVSSVEQDGNYIIAKFGYDIRSSSAITFPFANGDSADNFVIVVDGEDYTYSVDGNNNLVLVNSLGTNSLNSYSSSISNFLVQRLGNAGGVENSLKISFTVTSKIAKNSGFETQNFATTFSLRRQ
jgi:type II secretory pathway pseudopilin PulG